MTILAGPAGFEPASPDSESGVQTDIPKPN